MDDGIREIRLPDRAAPEALIAPHIDVTYDRRVADALDTDVEEDLIHVRRLDREARMNKDETPVMCAGNLPIGGRP